MIIQSSNLRPILVSGWSFYFSYKLSILKTVITPNGDSYFFGLIPRTTAFLPS